MSNRSRREFTRKAVFSPLSALLVPKATAQSQGSGRKFFDGFKREQIRTSGATINVVHGGKGSPVLLLHGIPETHVLWRKVAPALARNFTLVMADLRRYGDSSKPAGGANHFAYSKRAMAQDQVEVMEHLGFRECAVAGHDRGGRVAHRMAALDHSDRLTKLVILDIVPPYKCYQTVTKEFATSFFHWFLLVQPPPFPETMLGNSAELFLKTMLFRLHFRPWQGPERGEVGEVSPGARRPSSLRVNPRGEADSDIAAYRGLKTVRRQPSPAW